ncbi:hypothetical protein [Streptomyces omiyaensis]|uniref:hypothetical protein n=1 Tax=Streptomyces omiyaensis TaxID=68247 RepID=UPI0036FC58E2
MSVPEVLPIACEPGRRTSAIGLWDGGRFLASVTAAFPEGWTPGAEWRRYASIAVAPFAVRYEGTPFGLVVDAHEGGPREWAELHPDGLGFSAPWDGTHDT